MSYPRFHASTLFVVLNVVLACRWFFLYRARLRRLPMGSPCLVPWLIFRKYVRPFVFQFFQDFPPSLQHFILFEIFKRGAGKNHNYQTHPYHVDCVVIFMKGAYLIKSYGTHELAAITQIDTSRSATTGRRSAPRSASSSHFEKIVRSLPYPCMSLVETCRLCHLYFAVAP